MADFSETTQILRREVLAEPLSAVADPVLRRVYAHRGVTSTPELERSLAQLLPPGELPDLELAAKRLADATVCGEKILIVGDFDADGATSVALCYLILTAMGAQDVAYLVPNRFEYGYGLSPEIVALAAQQHPALLVTVDNGISSIQGVQAAYGLGMDVIITDHHLPGPERPKALAVVNPNLPECAFPSKSMAGVGVAYYVMGAVRAELRARGWFDARPLPNLAEYLDLVALGTVADVVPLDANNRRLIHQGIERMRAGRCRPGIKALVEIAKRKLDTVSAQDLGFAVGPRLNAAGRLEDMSIGIKCLLAEELSEARKLATALDQLNLARRQLEQDMVGDAQLLLAANEVDQARVALSVYHPTFHQGVVGIVAGRLRERFNKPVIAFADAGDTAPGELKGSARSIEGLHIRDVLDAMATSHPGLLLKFGGHAMAAGLSIKQVHLQRFGVVFDKTVRQLVSEEMLEARIYTDGDLAAADINLETAYAIAAGGPWGNRFPEPAFDGKFELVSQRVVGESHLKLVVKQDGRLIDGIAFRQSPMPSNTKQVRLVYKVSVNDYGQYPTVQLMVEYIEPVQ